MHKLVRRAVLLVCCFYGAKTVLLLLRWLKVTNQLKDQASKLQRVAHSPEFGGSPISGVLVLFSEVAQINHFRMNLYKKHQADTYVAASIYPNMAIHCEAITRDRDVIKHIFADKFGTYIKFAAVTEDIWGKTLATVTHGPYSEDKGRFYLHQRKSLTGIFKALVDSGMIDKTINLHTDSMINNIESEFVGNVAIGVDIKKYVCCLTFQVICEVAFGYTFKDEAETDKYQACFDNIFKFMMHAFLNPLWKLPYTEKLIKDKQVYLDSIQQLNDLCLHIIQERKEKIKQGASVPEDVLTMAMSEDTPPDFATDTYMKDLCKLVLIAGRDTSSKSLQFILLHIALDLSCQEKLIAELDGCYDEGVLDKHKLDTNWYLDAVIKETMRLYPPAPVLLRAAATDDVLPNGLKLSKGQVVMCDIFSTCRSEEVFDNPHEFIPERWENGKVSWDVYDTFQLPIFSAGPRICVGKNIAINELKIVIARLLKKYRLKLDQEEEKKVRNSDILYGVGVMMDYKFNLKLDLERR